MSAASIVILSSGSVFVESIASRLRQQLMASKLQTIDSRHADALQQVIVAQPALVIAEAADNQLEQVCPLNSLLAAFPKLTVIRLDAQHERMQVVSSEHRSSSGMSGLIAIIQSAIG